MCLFITFISPRVTSYGYSARYFTFYILREEEKRTHFKFELGSDALNEAVTFGVMLVRAAGAK